MNKQILAIFAVVVYAAVANAAAVPDLDESDIFSDIVDVAGNEVTPEQKKCIEDAVAKVKKENPDLAKWLDEVAELHERLSEKAKKCTELEDPIAKRKCIILVKIEARKEWIRLQKQLTPAQKKILGKLKGEIKKCLKN